jgi:hypothetical protein
MYKYMYILAQINSGYKYQAYNDVKSAYLYANRKNLNAWQPIKKPCKMQGFICAPLIDERCNYNAMIEYVTIRKLKG